MKINLLLNPANRSWIIEKLAERLKESLTSLDIQASITERADHGADLVHHMSWAFANNTTTQPSTMFITHLDDVFKIQQVKTTLNTDVNVGICMSNDTMQQLVNKGVPPSSLCFISPAHDGLIKPRKIVIGITSRVYSDGRKREALLAELANTIKLDQFSFRIFGAGWEPVIKKLENAGASVTYFGESDDFRKDYDRIRTEIPYFDYYLYLGMDEGSLGTLDALSAGVPTIVTPQGFHLDLPNGITHPVVTLDDLVRVFQSIAQLQFLKTESVAELTWANYAAKHAAVWTSIIEKRSLPSLPRPSTAGSLGAQNLIVARKKHLYINAMQPRRIVSAVSHLPMLRSLRRIVDSIRLKR